MSTHHDIWDCGGWTLIATKANNTFGSTNINDYGTTLSDPNTNTDNCYKQNWSQILLSTVRYDLNNYTAKFYFYNITDLLTRNYGLTALLTVNTSQTYRPDCWYNGTKYTNCGAGNNLHLGWVHDANAPFQWFTQTDKGTIGSGNFNTQGGTKARIWIK